MGSTVAGRDDEVARLGALRDRLVAGLQDSLGDIVSPTLVIGGRTDGVAPPENLEAMADRIPDARLVFCDGGHMFALQDKTAWPTVIDFLQA